MERIFYNEGQLREVVAFLPREPRWLILGGPADANEAQTARELWPDIQIIGIEPNVHAIEFQVRHGWPDGALLLPFVLSDKAGEQITVHVQPPSSSLRHASAHPSVVTGKHGGNLRVESVTLDGLEERYGPFEDAILWLDIEGWEPQALRGGSRLLASGRVILANLECQGNLVKESALVDEIMQSHSYRKVHRWHEDNIYARP